MIQARAREVERTRGVGAGVVLFFALASVGVLLVVDGVLPSAYAATGLPNITDSFLLVAVALALFVPGYVRMTKYTRNGGAMYAIVTLGLGRIAGVSVYGLAMTAYLILDLALYGIFGVQMAAFAAAHWGMGANDPWWAWALAVWLLVSIAGQFKIREVGMVLALLTCCEIVITVLISALGLAHAHSGSLLHPLSFTGMSWSSLGPGLAIAALGFIGFETTAVYRREARDPRRTVARATFIALLGSAFIYTLASWSMSAYYGAHTVEVAQTQGPGMFFALGTPTEGTIASLLMLTSLLAARIGYSQTWIRLAYVGAVAGMGPAPLGRAGARGVPRTAAVVESVAGLAAIGLTQLLHWSPLGQLFYIGGTAGGWAITCVLAVTSAAIAVFFHRDRHGEALWAAVILPSVAAVALAVAAVLATWHFAVLIGVAPGDRATYVLPAVFALVALAGAGRALYLKARRPDRYNGLSVAVHEPIGPGAPVELEPEAAR